jgi:pimeloyl-ACP methyl ester carboxylesterase
MPGARKPIILRVTRASFPDSVPHTLRARDGTELVFRVHGAGAAEPIILTNGLSTTDEFWRHIVAALAPRRRVVHWSYRGHGESASAASGDYTIATHADDLIRISEHAAHGPAVHVAFSMGVTVALEAYRRRPELVRALVLIGGGADAPYASAKAMRAPFVQALTRSAVRTVGKLARPLSPLVRSVTASRALFPLAQAVGALGERAPRDALERFFRSVGEMDPRAYWETLASLVSAHASDVLPTIRVPTLIIAPEHDVMVLHADLVALHAHIAGAEWEFFAGTGHALLLEDGPRVAARIARFVDALPVRRSERH